MQIRKLVIHNFRGIFFLNWQQLQPFCCIIGAGDSGKSTVLDAAEAALSSRWLSFSESDFHTCDTSRSINIEVTVGELSRTLKSDERFGLYIRGWTATGELRDEPIDGDEPALTVRLTVDATLEPVWELVCDRIDDPRTLSNRDRALFGLVRLAGDDARHLAWGQGSVLSRLTGDSSEAAARLAQAYSAARTSANLGAIQALADAAQAAERFATSLGAYVQTGYGPGLELGRSGLSSGSIALHDGGVPLRLAGLGTRRLATLAIQRSAIAEGAIVLVDEIEHGLEPHRIIGAISQLKATQTTSTTEGRPAGQVLLTTHSDVAVAEAGVSSLFVLQTENLAGITSLTQPTSPDPIQSLLRFTPRALFARRILVTEGNTEVGMLLGIRENWPARHENTPIEQLGAAIADGNGGQACSMALGLVSLGYKVAIFRDSDNALPTEQVTLLSNAHVAVIEYGATLNTEQALFLTASDARVEELINHARRERGEESIRDNLIIKFPDITREILAQDFREWCANTSRTGIDLRTDLAELFLRKKWFKDQRIGRGLSNIAWNIAVEAPGSPFQQALAAVEAWLYA